MSETQIAKAGPALSATVHEVRGSFPSDSALQDAIARLTQAGFDRADLSVPHTLGEGTMATPEGGAENPNTDTDDQQVRTLHTSMAGSVAAITAAGIVMASGGAALPAVAAAAAAGLGTGALAHAASGAAGQIQHDSREAAAAEGRLLLTVRVRTEALRMTAETAMRQAGALDVDAVRR
jgi:hypothetical protein